MESKSTKNVSCVEEIGAKNLNDKKVSPTAFVIKKALKVNKRLAFYFIAKFISSLAVPFLGSLLAACAVHMLAGGYEISEYFGAMAGLAVLTLAFEVIKIYSTERYQWQSTFVRCGDFLCEVAEKSLTDDYDKIEPRECQTKLWAAFEALGSNWVGVEGMLKDLSTASVSFAGMLFYGALTGFYCPYALLPLIFSVAADLFFTVTAGKLYERSREKINECSRENDYLRSVSKSAYGKDIRAFKLENWLIKKSEQLIKRRIDAERSYRLNNLGKDLTGVFFNVAREAVTYLVLASAVIGGEMSIASFTFVTGLTAGFSTWLSDFSGSAYRLHSHSKQVAAYRDFLEDNGQEKAAREVAVAPVEIELENVSFTYPGAEKPVLNGVSFKIPAGGKVALVGNNGAGKTTLVKLLCGLYRPTSGVIKINGEDISKFPREEYYKLISAAFQESNLFAFGVQDNVTCTDGDKANEPAFWQAIEKAGLTQKIRDLPKAEKTFVTREFDKNGVDFSGGEKQRLMLARAIYKNAPILLLDEPTAALDPINEEKIYKLYQSLAQGVTSVFISHRLASTRFCDEILVLNGGKISERGTHEQLMKNGGEYAALFEVQAKYYADDAEKTKSDKSGESVVCGENSENGNSLEEQLNGEGAL